MKTILIASLCAFWAVTFSLACMRAIGVGVEAGAVEIGALAVILALVAMLFVWCAVCTVFGERRSAGEVQNLVRLAVAGAVIAFAAMAVVGESAISGESVAAQFAALGITYLVMKAEAVREAKPQAAEAGDPIRRMARGAARGTVLSRLSRRGVTAENDA